MATPPTDDTRTLFKLLADLQWHDYEQTRDALAVTVPPGRALRKYDERLESSRKFRHNPVTPPPPLPEDDRIRFGQRACAQITITSWKGRGIIQRVVDGKKEIRIKPGFKVWGLDQSDGELQSVEKEPGPTEVPPTDSEPSEVDPAARQEPVVRDEPVPDDEEPAEEPAEEQPSPSWVPAGDDYAWPITVTATTCPQCGLQMVDEKLHEQWHNQLDPAAQHPEMALLDEQGLRTLLGDVTSQALDRFQSGMQEWLEVQFMQLSDQIAVSRPPVNRWAQGGGPPPRTP